MSLITNVFYYGDNLEILRKHIADESVDLIYLDPPFNSQRDYNILFKEADEESTAQIQAFEDTWKWDKQAEATYYDLVMNSPGELGHLIDGFLKVLGRNDVTAYLVMMAVRLVELRRVLKKTGSIYLHCDPTASHYLKILMDVIFGKKNFRNEIVWCYTGASSPGQRQFPRKHDCIFWYSNGSKWIFNDQLVRIPYSESTLKRAQTTPTSIFHGKRVKRTLHRDGKLVEDYWLIPSIVSTSKERMGYPTQKPLALLERIISASSKKGDVVLDPFCGCGTTVVAAQRLGRKWIGIDITHLAVNLMKNRIKKMYPKARFKIIGEPTTLGEAKALAKQNRYQFELWALSLVAARPTADKKGGADRGIDGLLSFFDNNSGRRLIIIQVKSGHVQVSHIRDLKGAMAREKAGIGVLLTLAKPSMPMRKEALSAGIYKSQLWNKTYQKIQIITVAELLKGAKIDTPPQKESFKSPAKEVVEVSSSNLLLL